LYIKFFQDFSSISDASYLQTPACDLKSLLALRLKRKILTALADKTLYPDDPEKHAEVYDKYKQYLEAVREIFLYHLKNREYWLRDYKNIIRFIKILIVLEHFAFYYVHKSLIVVIYSLIYF